MIPTVFAKLTIDAIGHKLQKGELSQDEALTMVYQIGYKDYELQQRIDTARRRAKEILDGTGTHQSTRDRDPW